MSGGQTVVFDTTVISNFATSDSLDWLQRRSVERGYYAPVDHIAEALPDHGNDTD